VLAALGRAGVDLDMARVDLYLGDVWVAEGGAARDYDEAQARRAMLEDPVRIRIGLGQGSASGWIWTCDLSHGYVEINAHYRS
jgi:glutamate N-acetyltransferase/amino-acid N-acetyltransferase